MNGNGKNGHAVLGPTCVTCHTSVMRGEVHCPRCASAWRRALLVRRRPYPMVAPLSSQEDV